MDLKVCRDLLAIITRVRCEKPSCGCNPRETMVTNMSIVVADPLKSVIRLAANANHALATGQIFPASFESGLLLGVAIAAASDHPDLIESIRAAGELNPDIKSMLKEIEPQ